MIDAYTSHCLADLLRHLRDARAAVENLTSNEIAPAMLRMGLEGVAPQLRTLVIQAAAAQQSVESPRERRYYIDTDSGDFLPLELLGCEEVWRGQAVPTIEEAKRQLRDKGARKVRVGSFRLAAFRDHTLTGGQRA